MLNNMFSRISVMLTVAGLLLVSSCLYAAPTFVDAPSSVRSEVSLKSGWRFHLGEVEGASAVTFDDSAWETVCVPHDWAITGPFSVENDLQTVRVTQNMETKATLKTGRTGGLPYVGVGWYRTEFSVPKGVNAELLFDGAMSEARVYVNGNEVCFWPYGYSPFHCDVTPYLNADGTNVLAVRLENLPQDGIRVPGFIGMCISSAPLPKLIFLCGARS